MLKTNKLLGISIPTFNRCNYLNELLDSIKIQLQKNNISSKIKIYVFDNNSSDNTLGIVNESELDIKYYKSSENIGGPKNVFKAYSVPDTKYVWVIGDDELIYPNGIADVLTYLEQSPNLIIAKQSHYEYFSPIKSKFSDYLEFANFAESQNPHFLLEHSLLSVNVVKTSLFNKSIAQKKEKTSYGWFYGLIDGVCESRGTIIVTDNIIVKMRDIRAPVLAFGSAQYIREQQIVYLEWLKIKCTLTKLEPPTVCANYYKRLILKSFVSINALRQVIAILKHYIKSTIARCLADR
jgi:glycosyltransferase involved in cell wall biosynthesis